MTLPVPEGWAEVASKAPLAAQVNVDLPAARAWFAPCAVLIDEDFHWLDTYGVRTARAALLSIEPDGKSGSGVASFDLVTNKWFASQLDEIPLRSHLESDRTYGPLRGHSLSIPFGPTVEYVLTDRLAFAAVGDGLLARVVGKGGTVRGPVAAIDVQPPLLSPESWGAVRELLDLGGGGRFVERLMWWREAHFSISTDGNALVLAASGRRR